MKLTILLFFLIPFTSLGTEELKEQLREQVSGHIKLSYRRAREVMFSELDNDLGIVCGVYSGECIETISIPDHRVMNCEHTWPQSKGATGIAKTDLHHLYPALAAMNTRRSNHPFCMVQEIIREYYDSKLGRNLWGEKCFEPPPSHRGNIARAMFYFSIRYSYPIDPNQEFFFKMWNHEDPVDDNELDRNDRIENYQNNRNPFVDDPSLADQIDDF